MRDKMLTNILQGLQETLDSESDLFVGELQDSDGTAYFESMLQAITLHYNNVTGDSKNNLEMTHLLNQLAAQMAVDSVRGVE